VSDCTVPLYICNKSEAFFFIKFCVLPCFQEKFQVAKLLGSSTLSKVGSHDIIDYSELVPKYSKKR
jgi:hypothetical protein